MPSSPPNLGHLSISGDILIVTIGNKLGRGQRAPPQQRITQPKMSDVLRLRNWFKCGRKGLGAA